MTVELIFAGDLILDEAHPVSGPDHWLSGIAPQLQRADVAIGHLEVPHTLRGQERKGDVPAPAANPEHVPALAWAGFHAVSLAGNHMADCGTEGIADTVQALAAARIAFTGAGATLELARRPAILSRSAVRVGLLSYNCVGPELSWASSTRAGCAYVRVETADGSPIAPAAPLQTANPESLAQMSADIAALRADVDIIVVALHKGIVHTPAKLAPYEQPIAHAAVDAGADIVIGHHAHIVRGIELYRDKPIFHGLGNGCVVTRALSPNQDRGSEEAKRARAAWARKRRELFGFEPDPAYELAPFHPEAINAMLGRVSWKNGAMRVGFTPVHIEAPGRPVLPDAQRAREIANYIERITRDAGLPAIRTELDGCGAWIATQ